MSPKFQHFSLNCTDLSLGLEMVLCAGEGGVVTMQPGAIGAGGFMERKSHEVFSLKKYSSSCTSRHCIVSATVVQYKVFRIKC